ncbi:MAG: Ig-like domain-containing protein [Gemmatimonadaceae bacterium]
MRSSIRASHRSLALLVMALLPASGSCTSDSVVAVQNSVGSVALTPQSFSLDISGTRQMTAVVYDTSGAPMNGHPVAWTSVDPSTASVNGSGLVTGLRAGTTRIVASAGIHGDTSDATITAPPQTPATVRVNPAVTYQTMTGWEATAQSGHIECPRQSFGIYKNALYDRAVNELGINRIRLEIWAGAENSHDHFTDFITGITTRDQWRPHWFEIVNDNADPNVADPAGFHFAYFDYLIDSIVTPMQQRLAARGERLYVNLNYVAFRSTQTEHKANPPEYAEFILATFNHIQSKYGWVPDAVEIILEPDNAGWTGSQIGAAVASTGARLASAGFRPHIIAPSNADMGGSIATFDQLIAVPGASTYLTDLAYHRYGGVSDGNLSAIGSRASQYGIRTAMLEHIGADHNALYKDLTLARNSSWQQFALAYCNKPDDGGTYYNIDTSNPSNPVIHLGSRSKFLSQYFRFVRLGAVRVDASTTNPVLSPLAWRNTSGKFAVVVRTTAGASFTVGGVPAGTYGIRYTTGSQFDIGGADATIASGGTISASIPAAGVITIYGR